MKTPRFLLAGGFALGLVIGSGILAATDGTLEVVGEAREADRVTFRVSAPGFVAEGDPSAAAVRLPGYEVRETRPGVPDLPRKTVLVAIPPGVTPMLEVRPLKEHSLPGIVPRSALRHTIDRVEEEPESPVLARAQVSSHEERVADPGIYSGSALYPASVAWLGKVGILRDQRYVEVHLAPVRYDPGLGGLEVSDSFEVTVRFDGDPGTRAAHPRPEPLFENVYRNAFVNYGQGTFFRLSASPVLPGEEKAPHVAAVAAGGPLYRIRVRQNGVVRLDYGRMSGTPFVSQDLATWKLTSRGVEVALQVQDDGDGVLEPGEWIQFYGQALDDEPKAVLNTDMQGEHDLCEARDFSDENIYFLSVENGARARMPLRAADPTNTRVPPASFEAVQHAEIDNAYRPLGCNPSWYWLPTLCHGCSGTPLTSRLDSIPLPGLSAGDRPLRAVVSVRGSSDDTTVYPDHRLTLSLLNASSQALASQSDDGTFDGRTLYTFDWTWTYPGVGPQASDPLSVKTEVTSSGAQNQVILDWIDVHYQRAFAAQGDGLGFAWPNSDAEFVIGGFASSNPVLYEVTDHVGSSGIVDAVRLGGGSVSGAGPYSIRFRIDQSASLPPTAVRRFVVAGDGAVTVPSSTDFSPDTVSDLRNTANQADLIVIASPSVLDASPGTPLAQLLALRAAQGLSSKIVLIQDVQDEFNEGLAGPLAIKSFLRYVLSSAPGEGWASPKPAYVLILGDGSYDYKGGEAAGNYVPTQILFKDDPALGYYSSDNVMADVVGIDQLADLMLGRITARSVAEANVVLQKVLDYEQNAPPGAWRSHALFISDRGKQFNPEEALDFEAINDESEAFLKRPPFTDRKLRYWSDYCSQGTCPFPSARDAMKSAILASVNGTDGFSDGAAIVQYSGHGNFDWWSDDVFFDDLEEPRDSSLLVNGGKLPWLMVHTCLTGGFHTNTDHSMGENWLKRSGGGAVAVFAPTGLDYSYIGHEVVGVVWKDLFGPHKRRDVATPVLDTLVHLCAQGSIDTCQHYSFQGDPTMRLVLPSVAPAGIPLAAPAHLRVELSWAASATPGVHYDLYRATNLVPENYQKINPASPPITGTSWSDTSVQNMTTYYYYVVAVDGSGYESAWSNFNSDCAVQGPDCVRAQPSNPDPPSAPTGLAVIDTERGGNLRATWNPNPEQDIKGYTLWLGTSSGSHDLGAFDVGKTTSFGLVGLQNGTPYYVTLTATNTSLRTSPPCAEVGAVPNSVQGIKPPAFIDTLHVNRSGANTVLTWSAVSTDIYGKPSTVASYEVYRGDTPNFVASLATRIATPSSPTYTDVGAMNLPTSSYYLVRAVDASGGQGGLGAQLPDGILTLIGVRPVPGTVLLSWPAVTRDFNGRPTLVHHYDVYASGQRFTRAQIRDGAVPLFGSTPGTSIPIPPTGPSQYYSVLAVDARGNVSPF